MSRSPRWSHRLAALLAGTAIVFAACAGTTPSASPSAASSAPSTAPSVAPSAPAFTGMVYPESGTSACGTAGYSGQVGLIKAVDATHVEFSLCAPDAAFLSKIAFTTLSIQDADYLASTGGGGEALVRNPVGTGPYQFKSWTAGQEIDLTAYAGYWGTPAKTPNAVIRWSAEAAQRLLELNAGTVDGIDNPGADDFETIKANADLTLYPRTALNIFYVGFTNTHAPFDNEVVRQAIAMGIDRQRIVDTFYPPGSSVATHFTPCDIVAGCEGDDWYAFDPTKAKQMLTDAGFDFSKTYPLSFRDVVRGYLPEPTVVGQELQSQLEKNLGIKVTLDSRDPSTYLTEASKGELTGIHMLGWGADYPDMTNFVDVHFGIGASDQFGTKFDDITGPLTEAAATSDPAARAALYAKANNAIKLHVPMIPIAHGGSATVFKADVEGAHSSPLGNEGLFSMKAGDRDQIVWLQNGEPGGLYCPDETDGESLRVCEQILEPLYTYETGGTKPIPLLATGCEANADSTVWTCTLREGVTFHNGSTFDANDVVTTFAVQWDAKHPLHVGKADSGLFDYWTFLFAGFLNPPPPAS